MRLLGPATADRQTVYDRLPPETTILFKEDIFPVLWSVAEEHGIDPVGMVAQSGLETGWGRFGGAVRPEFNNSCGLKIGARQQRLFPGVTDNDNPLAHAMFASWRVGATAHAQHLLAYAGKSVDGLIVDPRFGLVSGTAATTWADLGGRWAPRPDYGTDIEKIIVRLSRA